MKMNTTTLSILEVEEPTKDAKEQETMPQIIQKEVENMERCLRKMD